MVCSNRPLYAHIPSNLYLTGKHRDKYYFIITLIYWGRIYNKMKDGGTEFFTELNSRFLRKILGGKYKNYINYLLGEEILETDNHYIVNQKSKAYRLTGNYRSIKTKCTEIQDERILSNYRKHKSEQIKKISGCEHLKYLHKCLERIEIDIGGARDFLDENFISNGGIIDWEKYVSYSISLDLIERKEWFFVVDKTAGRVHHNITNLSRKLRPFLRFDNKRLIEIDISNSQPLLFNILIQSYYKDYTKSQGLGINPSYVQPKDVNIYKKLTESGKLYEYLMEKIKANEERDIFKKRFYRNIFYSRENKNYVNGDRKIFRELFPNVSEVVSYYKREDYRQLAIKMQRVEADLIINSVVPKLAEKNIYVITIHDSIMTLPEYANEVKRIIEDEFRKYNLTPTLKIKNIN